MGVPVTLTVGIVGDGNPDAIGTPRLPSIDGIYVDEPQRVNLATQVSGPNGQNLLYKLTPQRAGDIPLPALSYVYFDPKKAAYETAKTEPLVLHVRSTAKAEEQIIAGAGGTENPAHSIGADILEIDTAAGSLGPRGDLAVPTALGYVTPVAAYAAFALFLRRRQRFATDRAFARAHGALRIGTERLAGARRATNAADRLYHAVTGYIADQFDLPETGMTSAEAHLLLEARRVPSEVADAFTRILRACERARYAAAELSADETDALIQGAESAMHRLNEFLRQGGRTA